MEDYEVCCDICGEYFTLQTETPELGVIYGICPVCGKDDEHTITWSQNG